MPLVFPKLYVIMDAALLKTSEIACAQMLAESGVDLVQYRNKTASARDLFRVSESLAKFFKPRNVRFVVNDRPDIAVLAGAGGVHMGQDDLPVEDARTLCRTGMWVGVSTHNMDQFRMAAGTSADYIAIGPIFATETKANPDPVVGLELIREARQLTRAPLVAIGGITLESVEEVLAAGADSVAVAGDILRAAHPGNRARQYLDRIAGRRPA